MAQLDGILVADFSRVLAGPYATMLLGDLGADVVKVERPDGGDDTRAWGPPWHGDVSTYYLTINRNKRSVALDLTDEGDRALARELALRADVLVESFRPGLMAGWGLDGDTLRSAGNPGLVSCSVTAFGTGEAGRALPGYDFLLQAMGGLMHVTGEPDGPPLKVGAAVVDLICGLIAANGIQAALLERARTGAGRHVELSLMDAALTALLNQASAWVAGGVAATRRGNRHPSIVPYETFAASDRPIAIAVGNDRLFGRLCGALDLQELTGDERFATNAARVANRDELARLLGAAIAREPADHWVAALRAAAVPVGPINGVDEAFALADELGMEPTEVHDGVPLVRPPLRVDGERPAIRRGPPALDEHGDEIRSWLRG
ncbi:MAG TPA: CoA transferase [Solirubrobacteraceae bacterium]|nr:CoA transferase [Solirubrobacteraceae bacterium]